MRMMRPVLRHLALLACQPRTKPRRVLLPGELTAGTCWHRSAPDSASFISAARAAPCCSRTHDWALFVHCGSSQTPRAHVTKPSRTACLPGKVTQGKHCRGSYRSHVQLLNICKTSRPSPCTLLDTCSPSSPCVHIALRLLV